MENKKLILKVYKNGEPDDRKGVIRVSGKTLEILERLQRETGMTIKTLASRMIEYAAEYVEVHFED